jgi:hypothetical protein
MFYFDLANSLGPSRKSERSVGTFCRFAVLIVIKSSSCWVLFGSQDVERDLMRRVSPSSSGARRVRSCSKVRMTLSAALSIFTIESRCRNPFRGTKRNGESLRKIHIRSFRRDFHHRRIPGETMRTAMRRCFLYRHAEGHGLHWNLLPTGGLESTLAE